MEYAYFHKPTSTQSHLEQCILEFWKKKKQNKKYSFIPSNSVHITLKNIFKTMRNLFNGTGSKIEI
jgi:peptidase E